MLRTLADGGDRFTGAAESLWTLWNGAGSNAPLAKRKWPGQIPAILPVG
jgi:hypothetical protein